MVRRGLLVDRSGSIAVANTAQYIVSTQNFARGYIFFQNISSADLWINFDAVAVLDKPSIKVAAGASIVFDLFVPSGTVSVIGATLGQKFVYKEQT